MASATPRQSNALPLSTPGVGVADIPHPAVGGESSSTLSQRLRDSLDGQNPSLKDISLVGGVHGKPMRRQPRSSYGDSVDGPGYPKHPDWTFTPSYRAERSRQTPGCCCGDDDDEVFDDDIPYTSTPLARRGRNNTSAASTYSYYDRMPRTQAQPYYKYVRTASDSSSSSGSSRSSSSGTFSFDQGPSSMDRSGYDRTPMHKDPNRPSSYLSPGIDAPDWDMSTRHTINMESRHPRIRKAAASVSGEPRTGPAISWSVDDTGIPSAIVSSPDVQLEDLTSSTYSKFTQAQKKALVMFYDSNKTGSVEDWARQHLAKVAQMTHGWGHSLGTVDCAKESDLCMKQEIKSFPFFKLYSRGNLMKAAKDLTKMDSTSLSKVTNLLQRKQ